MSHSNKTHYVVFIDTPSISEEWTAEIPLGSDHASVIAEGITNPNDTNQISNQSTGPSGVRWDKYNILPGPPGIKYIYEFIWQFRWSGETITVQPGLRFRLYVGGIQRGSEILVDAAFPLQSGQVTFENINLLGAIWYAGPRVIWVGSDDQGGGKPPPDPPQRYQE